MKKKIYSLNVKKMLQIGGIIIDFGLSEDFSIIITVLDFWLFYFAYIFCSILGYVKKIYKVLNSK